MSKKEKLQKALAVSLMLTNIFCSPVWADPVDGAQGQKEQRSQKMKIFLVA